MLADDELRAALTARVPDLEPDVEAELDRLLTRADSLARRRRTTYAVGLVAAVTVLALVLGRDWVPKAETPEPTDDVPVRALDPARGEYVDPEDLDPGRYRARFAFPPVDGLPDVEIDVPAGWGQDNDSALATAPSSNSSADRPGRQGRCGSRATRGRHQPTQKEQPDHHHEVNPEIPSTGSEASSAKAFQASRPRSR